MSCPDPTVLRALADEYHDGKTFEELALDYGCKTQTMRRWLVDGEYVTPRAKGQRPGTVGKNRANAVSGGTGVSVRSVKSRAAWRGHRRRGVQR